MIESNEATTTEVTVDPSAAITTAPETNVTTDPAVVTAVSDAVDPATSTTDAPPVVTTDDPQPTSNIIDELKSIYKQIDSLNEQLDAVIKQRDQLLANSDACGSIKQEINRLLGKLVPYTNGYANFIQSLQNNLNNIEVSAKVDPDFFISLTRFTENYEPNDEEVTKIVSNLGGTANNRAGYSPLAILSSFNAVKNSARSNADVGNEYSRNVVPSVKASRPVPVAS